MTFSFRDFIDGKMFSPKGLFGYRPSYVLLRPHIMLREIFSHVKWAFQRVYRGWDDRVVWSFDLWLSEIAPPILLKIFESGITPSKYFIDAKDFPNSSTAEEDEKARKLWGIEIHKMIAGFLAHSKFSSWEYNGKDEADTLERITMEGMESFKDNFTALWT